MTTWNVCRIGLAAAIGLAMGAGSGLAGEEKLSRDDLPKAVRKAVESKFPKAKIRGVSKEVEDGKTTFEVEMTVEGRSIDAAFDAKGKVLEIEKEIPVSKLPKKVREELEEHFPGAKIEKAEEITRGEHGEARYEVAIKAEVVLTREGKLVKGGAEEEDEEGEEHEAHAGKKEKHDDDEHEHRAKAGEKHGHKGHGDAKGKGEKHDDDDGDR